MFIDNRRYFRAQVVYVEHDVAEAGEPDAKKGHDRRSVKCPSSPWVFDHLDGKLDKDHHDKDRGAQVHDA